MSDTKPQIEVITSSSLELIQRAEIDMQIATAKRYPRDLLAVRNRMESYATLDEETAESCFFMIPRDGKQIFGPSVRLAEIALVSYQNIRAASRVIANNGRVISAQAACLDLENNVLISVEADRRITDKNGKTYSEDMQITTGNAAVSIALRNAVFRVVPGALVKPVYEKCMLIAKGTVATLKVKRDKLIARLNHLNIDTARILRRLNRKSVEGIDLDDILMLVGLGTAIKDGNMTSDEAFPFGTQAAGLDDKMKEQAEAARQQQEKETAQSAAPTVAQSEKTQPDSDKRWKTREEMIAAFDDCRNGLGDIVYHSLCSQNGIASNDDLSTVDAATEKVYLTLMDAINQMKRNSSNTTDEKEPNFTPKNRK